MLPIHPCMPYIAGAASHHRVRVCAFKRGLLTLRPAHSQACSLSLSDLLNLRLRPAQSQACSISLSGLLTLRPESLLALRPAHSQA